VFERELQYSQADLVRKEKWSQAEHSMAWLLIECLAFINRACKLLAEYGLRCCFLADSLPSTRVQISDA
jgi:hypothetical protein